MKYKYILLAALIALFPTGLLNHYPSHATEPENCELDVPCQLGNRSFHVRAPDDWNGKTPLPVLIHFHGWGRQGKLIMNHGRIAGATRKLGVLLIAPNGRGRSWNFWTADTDDVEFTTKVLEEAATRWPIDRAKVFVSGYSYGSAMAWRYACAEPERINTLLAVSGSIPDQEERCAGPVNIRHVHGTSDTVMDYPFGVDGEVEGAVQLWRSINNCDAQADEQLSWQAVKILSFTRLRWNKCQSGKTVTLDVHKRGHFIPRFWIEKQLKDLL